jgi:hypothetical protein
MQIRPPNRVVRSYVQRLHAPPARVFPLLCPVREADWIEGWDPKLVISASGVAEPDCVFVTASAPADAIWVITRHEPDRFVEMLKITPGLTACRLTIALRAADPGCEATVTYAHTSLCAAGDDFVAVFTDAYYLAFMRDWERRLNHYLATGERLANDAAR